MKKYIPTEQETQYLTSPTWGNGIITKREKRNGIVILRADFNGFWREFNFTHYHSINVVSYAVVEDEDTIKQRNHQQCIDFLLSRGVQFLIHFTPIENLKFILRDGICPRNKQPVKGIYTDDMRLDRHEDASSISISYPNYVMLYRKRKETQMNGFAILFIDINALTEIKYDNIAYYQSNAAETINMYSDFKKHVGIDALKSMFADCVYSKDMEVRRADQQLSLEYTTHPQAEILIKQIIPPKYIRKIVLFDNTTSELLPMNIPSSIIVTSDSTVFWPDTKWSDYEIQRNKGKCDNG